MSDSPIALNNRASTIICDIAAKLLVQLRNSHPLFPECKQFLVRTDYQLHEIHPAIGSIYGADAGIVNGDIACKEAGTAQIDACCLAGIEILKGVEALSAGEGYPGYLLESAAYAAQLTLLILRGDA